MPAISYSVETGFVIFVNSPFFWSSSMNFLKPIWFAYNTIYQFAFLKNNRKPSTISVFFLYEDGWFRSVPIPSFGFGVVCFFGLGCFPVAVGMGKVEFLIAIRCRAMLVWMGWVWRCMLTVLRLVMGYS